MKKVIYCISDAHLGAGNCEVERRKKENLLKFMDKVKDEKADLIIAGDLFDFYFEYSSVIPLRFFDVLAKLKEIRKAGSSVWFIAGNHDYWVGPFFEKDIGVKVYRETMKFKFLNKKIFIAHGDGLGRFDLGHFLLQLFLRQRSNIFLFSLIHPNLAYALGRWVSKMSRQKSGNNKFNITDHPLKRFVKRMWANGYDIVILGHIHYPYLEISNRKVFALIGDWIGNFSYICLSEEGVTLNYFTG